MCMHSYLNLNKGSPLASTLKSFLNPKVEDQRVSWATVGCGGYEASGLTGTKEKASHLPADVKGYFAHLEEAQGAVKCLNLVNRCEWVSCHLSCLVSNSKTDIQNKIWGFSQQPVWFAGAFPSQSARLNSREIKQIVPLMQSKTNGEL